MEVQQPLKISYVSMMIIQSLSQHYRNHFKLFYLEELYLSQFNRARKDKLNELLTKTPAATSPLLTGEELTSRSPDRRPGEDVLALHRRPLFQGITRPGLGLKLSLYAEDLLLYVSHPLTSFPALLSSSQRFGSSSGVKVNLL